jgi:phosphomannomutase
MACSIPACVLIERTMPDGSETLLMATDLPSALAEAAQARATGEWFASRVVLGRDAVLEGGALAEAISAALAGQSR